jgi:hypothetical protein
MFSGPLHALAQFGMNLKQLDPAAVSLKKACFPLYSTGQVVKSAFSRSSFQLFSFSGLSF